MRKVVILSVCLSALLLGSSCNKKENPHKLTGISLYPDALEMVAGTTRMLSVLTVPDNAKTPEVQWSSSNPNLVSVSEEGLLKTSIWDGNAVITARYGDMEAHCNVRVVIPVQMFGFYENIQSKSMAVGEELSWGVIYMPVTATDHDIVFENSDPSVAELTQDAHNPTQFKVKAKKLGNTTITAKCGGKETQMLICVDEVKATKVTVAPASILLAPSATKQLTATVAPSDATNKSLLWFSMVPDIATVDENGLLTAIRPGEVTIAAYCGDAYAYCDVTVTSNLPENAVDMGLSVFWASANLDKDGLCSSPADHGAYYAWGETSAKSNYEWETYKFWKSGYAENVQLKKYNFARVMNLELVDDAARVKLGAPWRMPTEEEFRELFDNCTPTWTTLNGMNGVKFTSNKPGFTEQWIFFPAASYMSGKIIENDYEVYGKMGRYWSSSLYSWKPYWAWDAVVDAVGGYISHHARCLGMMVRPVCEIGQ